MFDYLSHIYQLLMEVILPSLKGIESSQAEQRLQTDRLNQNLEEFRTEMHICFAEIRAEVAACRAQVEDVMVTIRESEAASDSASTARGSKPQIH